LIQTIFSPKENLHTILFEDGRRESSTILLFGFGLLVVKTTQYFVSSLNNVANLPELPLLTNVALFVMLLLPFLYYTLTIKYLDQTLGQKVNSLKLLTVEDKKPSTLRIIARMFSNWIPFSSDFSVFSVSLREDKKSAYDLICSMKVIQFQNQKNLVLKSVLCTIIPFVFMTILGLISVAINLSK
jgi:purine-cytosine permease-like protein